MKPIYTANREIKELSGLSNIVIVEVQPLLGVETDTKGISFISTHYKYQYFLTAAFPFDPESEVVYLPLHCSCCYGCAL